MPEYLAPGVYIEEIPSGNRPIEGVSTSTAGMVGVTARGPTNTPTLVTSFGGFNRLFGGFLDHRLFTGGLDLLPYAAQGFFQNGGRRLYVTRIVGPNATQSAADVRMVPAGDAAAPTLALRAAAASVSLTVIDASEMADTNELVIADGDRSEVVTVNGAPVPFGVRFTAPIPADIGGGENLTVQAVTEGAAVTVTGAMSAGGGLSVDASGLTAGDVLRIRDTRDASRTEFVTITNNGDAAFDEPGLLFDHAQARTEVHVVTLAAGTATTPSTPPSAGATDVELTSTVDFGNATVVALPDGSIRVTVGVLATVALAAPGTANAHAAGVSIRRQTAIFRVHARYAGEWGNDLRVTARPASQLETAATVAAGAGETIIVLDQVFGLGLGSVLEVETTAGAERRRVLNVNTATSEVELATGLTGDLAQGGAARSVEFTLQVQRIENGRVAEDEAFENLSLDPEANRYAPRIVGSLNRATGESTASGESNLVRLSDLTRTDDNAGNQPGADLARLSQPDGRAVGVVSWPMLGGFDDRGNIDDDVFIGNFSDNPGERTGIQAMRNESAINIVAVPGRTSVAVQHALVNHCNLEVYRFAAIETPQGSNINEALAYRRNFDTTRAAVYYPWLCIPDRFGEPGDLYKIPPSGHVLGIYARTDTERGVFKAPANTDVRGILSFETALTRGEQDILNPNHVNCFRDFRSANRGLRLWGARTASSNAEWRYVPVRRTFLFIEQSLDNGLQFAVFEPNDQRLWATVKQSISNFLLAFWRTGGLAGATQEQAFFVNVGLDITMTEAEIDAGQLIVEVGIAPVKPAEFVIIRLSQKTLEATA